MKLEDHLDIKNGDITFYNPSEDIAKNCEKYSFVTDIQNNLMTMLADIIQESIMKKMGTVPGEDRQPLHIR